MLRDVDTSDSKLLFSWRNSQEVRSGLFTQELLEFSTHCKWVESSIKSSNKNILIFEDDGHPCGFAQLDLHANKTDVYQWGFYKAPGAAKGTGYRMLHEVLEYAFVTLSASRVIGKVLGYNEASIKLHERLGFERQEIQRRHHRVAGEFHDVVIFDLTESRYFETSGGLNAN